MSLPFSAPIVGARFRPPAADVLNNLSGETELVLVREPSNEHDSNAIKVMVDISFVPYMDFLDVGQEPSDVFSIDEYDRYHLGYVPKDRAEYLASMLDKIGGTISGKLAFSVEGRPVVEFELPE